jgi:alpha-D-ribose 1-methylphosphonate 5-phosphate C-P lyase
MELQMAKPTKAERAADKRTERAYYATCSGVQIRIMDMGKVYVAGREAITNGADDAALAVAVRAFVETIRVN